MSDENEQKLNMEESNKPLTDWKNEPTVRDLKQDLLDAQSTHNAHTSEIDQWLDNLHVTGGARVDPPKGNSRIVPKLIRKQAEWRYAALSEPFLNTDDMFDIRPVTWEDRDAAQQNQLILNNQFCTQIPKIKFIDSYVRAAVDEGTVIVRVGWDFQEEEAEEEVPIVEYRVSDDPEVVQTLEEMAILQQESPSEYQTNIEDYWKEAFEMTMEGGEPIEPVVIDYEMQMVTNTVRNRPTLEVCDYRNVVLDPSANGDMEKANFVIYSFESSLSQLEKDGKYKNLDQINIDNNTVLGTPDHESQFGTSNFNFSDKPRKKFVVHEYWGYWDIDGSGVVKPFVAAWVGDTLIRMEENPFPDKKIPFVVVPYLPKRRSLYGESDGSLLEDNQKVIGAVTRGMIDLLGKSANGQTGVRKDALDVTNKRKFEKGQDYEFNANVHPDQAIYMHQYPEIPQSAQYMLNQQNLEAESMTGVKAFSQGISGQSLGNTATGVRSAMDAASKRELGILRRLSDGMIQIGRKIISMNAEFLSEEEVVRITNEEFVTVRRDDLAGKFDLRLSISTPEEDQAKADNLAFMLQTMGNNMDPAMSQMILSDIARLKKMPDLAKKIADYEPQPDPMQQKKAELEIKLLEAQIEKEMSYGQYYSAQAHHNMARSNTEQAKTGKLISETDLANLNYIEQESGVKQERDKERIETQARSQAELAKVQADLDREKEMSEAAREYLQRSEES